MNVVAAVLIALRPAPSMVLVALVEVTAACVGWVVALWLPPRPTGDGDEPGWWPEFEREFAAYAARPRSERVR